MKRHSVTNRLDRQQLAACTSVNVLDELMRQAYDFAHLSRFAWSLDTTYSPEAFAPLMPNGQCAVTSLGFAIWCIWQGYDDFLIRFHRGSIQRVDGTVIGPNHTWINFQLPNHGRASWPHTPELDIDMTPSQFPEMNDYFIAVRLDSSLILDPGPDAIEYVVEDDKSMPLANYDTSKLNGRLVEFMKPFANLFAQHVARESLSWSVMPKPRRSRLVREIVGELWWPRDSSLPRDVINKRLCEGVSFTNPAETILKGGRLL